MRFRGLLAVLAVLAASAAVLAAAGPAGAATTFGGDPAQAPLSGANCSQNYPGYPGAGSSSCMWETTNPGAPFTSSDYVPFSASGGSGTITSVTLPAMPNPGPMQAVVLTQSVTTTTDPGHPDTACCQVKEISPTFTVPANTVTTVPLNMHVTDSDVNGPTVGDTAFADVMAISVLSPSASLPLSYTGGAMSNTVSYPAPAAATGEYRPFGYSTGFQLLARFTLDTGAATGGGGGNTVVSPAGGLKLGKTIGVPAGARKVTVGTATNPPTAATRQRLTATPKALGATAAKKKKAKRKTIGTGKTTVKAGTTSKVRVTLSRAARRRLAHGHKVKCTLTVVATGTTGAKTTVTRNVTLKAKKRKKK